MQKILHKVKFNHARSDWTLENSEILTFYQFFKFFDFLVQSEVQKIILVKFCLRKVRFNPRKVWFYANCWAQQPMLLFTHWFFYEYFLGPKKMEGRWNILLHNSI